MCFDLISHFDQLNLYCFKLTLFDLMVYMMKQSVQILQVKREILVKNTNYSIRKLDKSNQAKPPTKNSSVVCSPDQL